MLYPKLKMENEITIKVTIWNEGRHEKLHPNVAAIYPSGIHSAISAGLENEGFAIRCGSLDDPDEGLGEHAAGQVAPTRDARGYLLEG